MRMQRSDRQLILLTSGILILAGLFFASVLIFATGGSTPDQGKGGPLYVGPKSDIVAKLEEGTGSPLYFANPFGGRGFWMDREDGDLVALDVGVWRDSTCSIRWRGREDSYVDCDGRRLQSTQMARHPVDVILSGERKGSVFVDLDVLDPPPASDAGTSTE